MMYLRWCISAVLAFAINLVCWLTGWFWALIPAALKLDNLPGFLWYLQTHDDNVYGEKTHGPMPKRDFVTRWWWATCWLARNPGYAFDAYLLGLPAADVVWTSDYSYRIGKRGFGYKRDVPLIGKAYWKIWIGWHNKTKGDSGRHMLKIAFGPKFG